MSEERHTFPAKERLKGEKTISSLFTDGKSGFCYPFRYVWRVDKREGAAVGIKVLISVPKKHFKRAVKRNLLKRRTREAYRLNKDGLTIPVTESNKSIQLAFIYSSKELHDFKTIENGVKRILGEILGRI